MPRPSPASTPSSGSGDEAGPGLLPLPPPLALVLALPLLGLFARGLPHFPSTWRDLDVVVQNLVLAGLGTLFTLSLALGLATLGLLGRVAGGWEALLLLGYLVPPFVTGMGVLFSLGALGVRIQGVPGILLAWTLHYAPLTYLLLKPQVRLALGLLATAQVHGATGLRALRAFLPPLFPPLLVAGGTLYLALLGNFGVPAVLGLPERVYVLPTLAYARLLSPVAQDPLGEAAALGLWLALLALPAALLSRSPLLEAKEPLLPPPRPLYRIPFALYSLIALALVLLGLLREALQNPYTGGWDPAFAQALALPLVQKGLRNSLLLALGATGILLLLAMALRPFPCLLKGVRGVLDIHYLLPGTLLGVGLILLLAPTPLYGTPWILLLASLLNFAARGGGAREGGP
ncbi:MAG: ABC transporter permease, partial [Thermus sp.]